jgi:hypothetical protein
VSAVIGVVIGLPLGIAERWLWTLFARQIYAVPLPSVPVLAVALVALGTLVLANAIAAPPGLIAARTQRLSYSGPSEQVCEPSASREVPAARVRADRSIRQLDVPA